VHYFLYVYVVQFDHICDLTHGFPSPLPFACIVIILYICMLYKDIIVRDVLCFYVITALHFWAACLHFL
jgi:hypothetical protein